MRSPLSIDFFAGVGVTAFLAVTVLFNDPSAPQCPACPNLTCPGNVPATLQSRDEKANPVTPISAVSSVKAYEDWKKTQTPEQLARQQSLSKPREQLSERRVRIRQPKATDHFDVPKNSAAMELTRRLDTAATKKGGDVDGRNPTGNIGATAGQMAAYAWHASQPGVKTICESGFSFGHSAVVFLEANPNATVVSLDLVDVHPEPGKLIKERFPGRFFFFAGDTSMTIPQLGEKLKGKLPYPEPFVCDVVSIDGGGQGRDERALEEFRAWAPFTHANTAVLVDDCHMAPAADCNHARSWGMKMMEQEHIMTHTSSYLRNRGDTDEIIRSQAFACWCEAVYS